MCARIVALKIVLYWLADLDRTKERGTWIRHNFKRLHFTLIPCSFHPSSNIYLTPQNECMYKLPDNVHTTVDMHQLQVLDTFMSYLAYGNCISKEAVKKQVLQTRIFVKRFFDLSQKSTKIYFWYLPNSSVLHTLCNIQEIIITCDVSLNKKPFR